jgi:porin
MTIAALTRGAGSLDGFAFRLLAVVACLCVWGDPSLAQPAASLSGPSSVPAQIRDNDAAARTSAVVGTDPLKEFRDANARRESDYGLTLGADYQALFQHATVSPGAQNAAGNALRLYGQWSPFDRRAADGSLVFKVEYRGKLGTSITPQALGPAVGYAGLTAVTFSDASGLLTNLYWKQAFDDNRFAFVAGVVDVTDYLDVYALVNPWTEFNNLSFSTNPTIPAPSQGLGAAAHWRFTPNYYVLGGIADANGNPHQPQDFFAGFFNTGEYFYHLELGWIGSWEKRVTDNVHLSLWGQDPRAAAGVDRGRGITFSASRTVNERWKPFLRAGYSSGGGAPVDRMLSAGLGYRLNDRNDYVGFGAGWARPPAASPGARVENQYTFETYYRLQLLPHVQIVPSVQFIANPPNNPTADSLWVVSMRLRAAF